MTRTIKVTGKSNTKASPDYTRISLTLSDTLKEYDACLAKSVEDMNIIVECIKHFGFERSELKTSSFEIDRKKQSYRDKYDNWKERFLGYEYTENVNFTFKNDNVRLGKILYALAHLPIVPEIRISYFCNDVESIKNRLLELAIKDAKKKAELLTSASGVKLCEILDIDYSWVNVTLELDDLKLCPSGAFQDCCDGAGYDVEFEPDDISTSDSVRITFRIE
jgi:uncharacterized protein YggE